MSLPLAYARGTVPISRALISHAIQARRPKAGLKTLTKFDPQPATPPPAVTEMRPFKRIAEVVCEKFAGDIQNVKLDRAGHLLFLEQIDAGGEVEDRARPDAPALEVREFGAGRGFQLFEPALFDLQRRAALVPAREAQRQARALAPIHDAERAGVALILIGNEADAGTDFDELAGQKQSAVDRAGLQQSHVRVTQPARPAFALRNVQPHVNAAREAFGHAVRKDDRRVEEDVRVADVAKIAAPVCGVQPKPPAEILSEPGLPGRGFLRVNVSAAACRFDERRKPPSLRRLRKKQVIHLRGLVKAIERSAQRRLRLRYEIHGAEARAELLIGYEQAAAVVAQTDLQRQIARRRKLVLRVERKLSPRAAVAEDERIVAVEIQRHIADLTLFGHILIGNVEGEELSRGDAAHFNAGLERVTAAHVRAGHLRAGLMRQAGDQTRASVRAILLGENRDVIFAPE